jgi:WD40 repeat protein
MGALFVSHSSSDQAATKQVVERLDAEGFVALFLDFHPVHGIPAGGVWESELYAQLRKADGVVFLASAASVESQWCFAEISLARSLHKPVFPLRLEAGVRLDLLDDVQWIDLSDGETAFARLWAGLRQAGLDPADPFAWDPTRSPYPGLESFTGDDAAVFFGRDDEIIRLVELLQPTLQRGAGRFVAVVGPSGSGKSSLVRAGLLPRLERLHSRWVVLPALVPDQQPTRNLAHCLAAAFATRGQPRPLEEITAAFRRGGAGLVELAVELGQLAGATVHGGAASGRVNVLVVIDQAEELLTRTGITEQQAFLGLLRNSLGDDSPVWVVATVRSEFLSTAPERAGLAEVIDDPLVIEPLSRARLPIVIQQPAQRAGLQFAPGLVEQMVEETTGGDALPLLAFMLRELYEQAGADDTVTVTEYQELGGVVGALQRRAGRITDELNRRGGGEPVLPTLTKFAVVEGDAEPTSRRIPRSALGPHEQAVADAFVEARLLTSGVDADGAAVVGVAHEALLRQWRPLREAIEASRASLRMRSELERLAADWNQGGRDESYLLRGARLAAFDEWATDHGGDLGPLERQFIDAANEFQRLSIRRERRRRRRAVTVLSILLILAVTAGGIAFGQGRAAQQQLRIATAQNLASQADTVIADDPRIALLLGIAALDINDDPATRSSLVNSIITTPFAGSLTGHTDSVREVAFSRDGRTLATGSRDYTVRLWDPASKSQVGPALTGHTDQVSSVAFSRDGRTLAAGSNDKTVSLWNVKDKAHPVLLGRLAGHTAAVESVAFSPDGKTLASGSDDKSVRLWDVASHRLIGSPLTGHTAEVYSVAFSPDGRTLASGSRDKSVILWNVTDPSKPTRFAPPIRGHPEAVNSVAFSLNGRTLATASRDFTVRLWNLTNPSKPTALGKPLTGHRDEVFSVAFSPDGTKLATGSEDHTVRLWNLNKRNATTPGPTLLGHLGAVFTVAFSPTSPILATGGDEETVILWDLKERPPAALGSPPIGHHDGVNWVAFGKGGKTLASGSADGSVRLWNLTDRHHPALGPSLEAGESVESGGFSSDGELLASGSDDGALRLWRLTGTAHAVPLGETVATGQDEVASVAFRRDGHVLATGGDDGTIRLWNVTDRANPTSLSPRREGHDGVVSSVAFSPDGKLVATGSEDEKIGVWNVADPAHPALIATSEGNGGTVESVAFSRDGQTLISGNENSTVVVWDITNPASPTRIGQPLRGHNKAVTSVALSPDGKLLATASDDFRVQLWDFSDRAQPAKIGPPLVGHQDAVTSVAFSLDGRTLASVSDDRTLRLWDLGELNTIRHDPLGRACAVTGRSLNRGEWDRYAPRLPYNDSCAR